MVESDAQLLVRMGAGDETALRLFYQQYVHLVFSMALHVLHDHAAAEETTQDVFWTIWRRAMVYDSARGSVASWLLTITRRRAIDQYRRTKNHATNAGEAALAHLVAPLDAGADLDIHNALADLSAEQRACVHLVYFAGLTHHEVAAALHIPPGTVKSRLRLALQHLRQVIRADD